MTIRQLQGLAALGVALFISASADAATTFSFTCQAQKSGSFTIVPSSFTFQLNKEHQANGLPTGKETYSLSIRFPMSKAYSALQGALEENENLSTCKLTETVGKPGTSGASDSWTVQAAAPRGGAAKAPVPAASSGEVYEWTFVNAQVTNLTATGTDGTGTSPATLAEGSMQATFSYQRYTFEAKP
jgi:hypothetical protein